MNLTHRIFQYELPTEIVFGINAITELPARLKKMNCSRVFVISDPGVAQSGILQKVTGLLEGAGIAFSVFSDVDREPDVKTIGIATEKAKEFKADVAVGVGGGSAQDAAKAVAVMVNNEGKITQYAGLNQVPNQGVPIVCIPTTSGTGSEVTIWSVISEKEKHMKFGIGGKYLTPTLAICDPSLTLSLPPHITAATGMDALAHALESFVNKASQPISRALSRESMRLIAKSLRKAVAQGENLEARYDMMMASTIAAMAFNPTRLGLAHSLAMPLGGQFKVAHGLVNAILLPQVMAFNLPGNLEGYKEIAEIFGENTNGLTLREAAERSVKAVAQLNEDIGIPDNLREYGIAEKDLDAIAAEAMASGNTAVNPRKTTVEDFKEILRKLM